MAASTRALLAVFFVCIVAATAQQAPDTFMVHVDTTVATGDGSFTLNVTRAWAPNGADRFYQLLQDGYYDENGFFRVVPGFVVQFGISGNTTQSAQWKNADIPDDPTVVSNRRGTVSYASAGPNTRTTQLFINYVDNRQLDPSFPPFANVTAGMDVVDAIYSGYMQEPLQFMIYNEGNEYLQSNFPNMDYIISMSLVS